MNTPKVLGIIPLCVIILFVLTPVNANQASDDSNNSEISLNSENNPSVQDTILPDTSTANNKPVISNGSGDFPYIGIITGDSVNVRSGPATPYYPVGKLGKDQEVIVTQIRPGKRNWARIEPVTGTFAYISSKFVEILETTSRETSEVGNLEDESNNTKDQPDQSDLSSEAHNNNSNLLGKELLTGIVIADNVRIRAGSKDIAPQNAIRILMLAKKGQQVKIIGKRDDFYKIVPPRGSYFWVAADYISRSEKSTNAYVNTVRNKTQEQIENINTSNELKSQYVQLRDVLAKYEAVQKMPLMDRDYVNLRADAEQLAKQTDSSTVKKTAEMLLKNILEGETAQKQLLASIAQDKKIEEAMQKIDQAVDKALKENMPVNESPDIVVAKGKLTESAVFTTGVTKRYLLLDDAGMISYYVSGNNLEVYVGKKISISGPSSFDPSTQTRSLEATRVVIIE